MTEAQVKAELVRRFEALMVEETEQMRAGGASQALIDAFLAENQRRFEAALPNAVVAVRGGVTDDARDDFAAMKPIGSA